MIKNIFFNSSMPRSMSTVFQNIVGQNEEFYVTPTSGVIELLFASRIQFTDGIEFKAQDSEVMKKAFLSYCRSGLFGYFNGITDKKYILDKSRGWIAFPDLLYSILEKKPKIICLVRNIKSIISSMEKMYRANPHLHKNIIEHSGMKGTTVEKRVDIWLSSPPVGLALERISECIRRGWNNNILFIRAEDLCSYPEQTMKKFYDHLEISYYKHNFGDIQQITKEDDVIYGLSPELHKIRPSLEYVKSDYKDILGNNVCKWLDNNLSWYQSYFNY